ncbi:hypothetical protein JXI42_14040 [bacterium]|nr:hypothetical protein [bacterium]
MDFKKLCVLLLSGLLVFMIACDGDDDDDNGGLGESAYMASGAVNTNEEALIETESGASIYVPMYAVPNTDGGENGTMIFSIERNTSTVAPVPAGETIASDVYRFGPDGFVLARPVRITIPITNPGESVGYRIYRINPTTGEAEPYPTDFDEENQTLSTTTYHFSEYFPTWQTWSDTYDGALRFTNNSSSHWLYVTSVSCSLKYPDVNNCPICGYHHSLWAPSGTIGWNNGGNWYIAQGTHRLCFEMQEKGTFSTPPGPKQHVYVDDVVVNGAWSCWNNHYSHHFVVSTLEGLGAGDPIDGPCDCTPEPTPSVGTGDVQVTLTWHNERALDLDLWVYEPSGERCYYGNVETETGGTLDRDNKCDNYINGQPENIFWSTAPAGEYSVVVHWFGSCGNSYPSQSYDVRVINGSQATTYSGTLNNQGETQEVCTFTVSGASKIVAVSDFIGTSRRSTEARPPKE